MKTKVLVDLSISCEPPNHVGQWCRTLESRAKELESWVRDFQLFIRDHRSQDPMYLSVERKHEEQCSHCHNMWEEDADGPLCCAKAQDEWNESKEKVNP